MPAFLDEVMFASYDVVLRYDRSRGVRATRGSADWSDWLTNALGREGATMTLLREPGSALELIDRYLLRTLNLQAIADAGGKAPRRIAVVIEFAEFVVPRGDALQLGGPFAANVVKVLGWANDPGDRAGQHRHRAGERGAARSERARRREPARGGAARAAAGRSRDARRTSKALAAAEFPTLAAESEVPLEALGTRLTGLSRVGARTAIALALRNGKKITAAWLAGIKKDMIERECQGLLEFIESPFTLDNVAGLDAGEGLAARRRDAAASAARCTRCRWAI